MQDEKDSAQKNEDATTERLAEATNAGTLSDVRTDEKLPANDSTNGVIPAPDGSIGKSERADGSDTGEPM